MYLANSPAKPDYICQYVPRGVLHSCIMSEMIVFKGHYVPADHAVTTVLNN